MQNSSDSSSTEKSNQPNESQKTKKSETYRKREFFTILMLASVIYLGFYFPQPLLAHMAEHLHITDATAGLLITTLILPFAFGPFLYGHVLRIFGLRRLLFVLMPICAGTLILPYFYANFPFLICCRIIQGITLPGILMCLTAHTAIRYSGAVLQRAMALYSTTIIVSAYVGRIISGEMARLTNWQTTFLFFGIIHLLACIPMRLFIKEVKEQNYSSASFDFIDIVKVLTNHNFLPVLLIAPLTLFCTASFNAIIPFRIHSIDPNLSTDVLGYVFFGGFLGGLSGFASKRMLKVCHGEWNTVLYGISLILISMQSAWIPSEWAIGIGLFFATVGFSMMNSTVLGLVNRATPYSKGLTNSTYLALYYLFCAISTYIPLAVFSNYGFKWYDAIIFTAFVLNFCLVLRAKHTVKLN